MKKYLLTFVACLSVCSSGMSWSGRLSDIGDAEDIQLLGIKMVKAMEASDLKACDLFDEYKLALKDLASLLKVWRLLALDAKMILDTYQHEGNYCDNDLYRDADQAAFKKYVKMKLVPMVESRISLMRKSAIENSMYGEDMAKLKGYTYMVP